MREPQLLANDTIGWLLVVGMVAYTIYFFTFACFQDTGEGLRWFNGVRVRTLLAQEIEKVGIRKFNNEAYRIYIDTAEKRYKLWNIFDIEKTLTSFTTRNNIPLEEELP